MMDHQNTLSTQSTLRNQENSKNIINDNQHKEEEENKISINLFFNENFEF